MSKIYFYIPIPKFIENLFVYFLLRHRNKKHGYPFRLIKLIQSNRKAKPIYAKVDADDYAGLSQFDWHCVVNGADNHYACRLENRKIIYMHREITNAPKGLIVDHINHDGLDNTKKNLQLLTVAQNTMRCRKTKKPTSSKYKGVSFINQSQKWRASICYNGIHKNLGEFENEEDAARAYDNAARLYHREFAVLNFPNDTQIKIGTFG